MAEKKYFPLYLSVARQDRLLKPGFALDMRFSASQLSVICHKQMTYQCVEFSGISVTQKHFNMMDRQGEIKVL